MAIAVAMIDVMVSVIRITLGVIATMVMIVIAIVGPIEPVLMHNDHFSVVVMMLVSASDQQQPGAGEQSKLKRVR
jgi:hypothetical protein